jgi:hypothetical protein
MWKSALRKFWSRLVKLTRVTAYFAFVAFVLFFFGARSVWGSAEKGVLEIGHGLVAMGDLLGPAYRVHLNGEPMNVASSTTDMTVTQVLDRFEAECHEHSGALEEDFKKLSEALKDKVPPQVKGPAGLGIIRKEESGRGVVACLARDDAGGMQVLLGQLREMLKTGDLARVGKLRYVTAEGGKDGKTHVVSVWTDGNFRIGRMFPKNGDAPGADLGVVMRPPDALRLLTAGVDGSPFGVHVYESVASQESVLAHYDREMPRQGWRRIEGAEAVSEEAKSARIFIRGAVDLIVSTEPRTDGHTVVSIVSMPPR